MKKTKIIVLVGGGGRSAANLHKELKKNSPEIYIDLIIASNSKIKAIKNLSPLGIPIEIAPEKEDHLIDRIKKSDPDFIILAGWLKLFPMRKDFDGKVINIHPSLLPEFGGQGFWGEHVHKAVLKSKKQKTGCTVHFVNKKYDQGPIILQRTCQVLPTDTVKTLANRVFAEECIALPKAVLMLANGDVPLEKNDSLVNTTLSKNKN